MKKLTNYERYQLEWMIEHNHSIGELLSLLLEEQQENPENTLIENFNNWEFETGFAGGEIWACKDEWEDYEGYGKNADDIVEL
nr:MAG TPA: hypothetical protein [Caudoviricetes sp.]